MCWALPKDGQEHSNIKKANTALKNFFKREDTLSVGIVMAANFMELEVINPEHNVHGKCFIMTVRNTKVSLPL
jgi:hypothetical protein